MSWRSRMRSEILSRRFRVCTLEPKGLSACSTEARSFSSRRSMLRSCQPQTEDCRVREPLVQSHKCMLHIVGLLHGGAHVLQQALDAPQLPI